MGVPSLLRLQQDTAPLDEHGFELLLVEDRTHAVSVQYPGRARDQEQWGADFATRYGAAEHQWQRAMVEVWLTLLRAERAGDGMFVCRRRSS